MKLFCVGKGRLNVLIAQFINIWQCNFIVFVLGACSREREWGKQTAAPFVHLSKKIAQNRNNVVILYLLHNSKNLSTCQTMKTNRTAMNSNR